MAILGILIVLFVVVMAFSRIWSLIRTPNTPPMTGLEFIIIAITFVTVISLVLTEAGS